MTKMTKTQIAEPATTEDLAIVLAITADDRPIPAELADKLVARGDVAEARAKVAEEACHHLMVAVGPFADYADERRRTPEDYVLTQGSLISRRQLRMRDCYRAADAVQKAKDLLGRSPATRERDVDPVRPAAARPPLCGRHADRGGSRSARGHPEDPVA